MKRLLVGIAAVTSLIASSAFAADLPARTYTKAPVYVDPIFNWTGWYVGGNLGYSWGRSSDTSTLTTATGTVLLTTSDRSSLNGVVGGGQVGYNWQMQNWLFGLETDIQGTGEKGSRAFGFTPAPIIGNNLAPTVTIPFALNQKIDWFGTFRGRIGVLATPKVLLYVTGGLAYGEVASNEAVGGVIGTTFSQTNTKVGYTLGAGIEGVIGGNWTAKLEYLYVDLGTVNGSFTLAPSTNVSSYSSRVTDNILRAGVNYHFGGPIVARY